MSLGRGTEIGGKYRLSTFISRGGMGVVWEAEDLLFPERTVAVKFLLDEGNERSRDRFHREARILASVSHPGMVQVFDRGQHEDQLYFVMERMRGEDLYARLEKEAPLPIGLALQIGIELCDVVAAVHAVGIVHRDLKPSNVFLAEYGNRKVVKVLDFGIAKAKLFGLQTLTATNDTMGTWQYMAPEVLLGQAKNSDARSDVFAIGAILYECLTGHRLHRDAASGPEIITTMLTIKALPSIGRAQPDLPRAIVEIVDGALSFDPALRPADARALCTLLEQARSKLSPQELEAKADVALAATVAVPAVSSNPSARPKRRRLVTIGGGVIAGLGIAAAVMLSVADKTAAPSVIPVGALAADEPRPPPDPVLPIRESGSVERNARLSDGDKPGPLPPERHVFRVESTPAGAKIAVGTREVCVAPCDVTVEADSAELSATLRGYKPASKTVGPPWQGVHFKLVQQASHGDLPTFPKSRPWQGKPSSR